MYLKFLKLAGFKSFADRTLLEFEPGVSMIVGPNGTGKSNIVDAVAWVLGTQFTRTLRTDKMEDVIFAGTATRPPHSRAEVTVVLDNRDRVLPLDLDEVSLTRRLLRGGISEYEINGVQCRLLDVQELLSDSGVGRQQHLIIGQGRLDSILTAKGDQRRLIIEEAAGIIKHQVRKNKALRRLERTDSDVLRLHDIIGEIKRRKRPLRRQAEAAERHEVIHTELRSLRLWLGGDALRLSRRRSRELSEQQGELEASVEAGRSELRLLEQALARMEQDSAVTARALERDVTAAARLDTVAARLRGIAQVARERMGGLAIRIEEARARRITLAAEAEHLSVRLQEASASEEAARSRVAAGEAALRASEDRFRSIPVHGPIPAETELATMQGDLRSLQAAAARDSREAADLADRLETVRSRIDDASEKTRWVEEEISDVVERLESARLSYDALTEACGDRKAEWERADRHLRSARAERIATVAKADALESVAGLSDAPLRERLQGFDELIGGLAGLLDIPDELAAAVDVAAGDWAEALVFDQATGMRRVVGLLKSEGRGGIPLIVTPDSTRDPPARQVARELGVEALVDLLGPAADRALAATLLGDVVLVEGWGTGWDIVQHAPNVRAVTPEGDLITYLGVCPADPAGVSPRVVQGARRAAQAAGKAEARAGEAESEAGAGLERARRAEESAREQVSALEATRARAAGDLERLHRAQSMSSDEMARMETRLAAVSIPAAEREYQLTELRERIDSARDGLEGHRQSRELLAQNRVATENQHAAERLAREGAIRALGAAVERRRSVDSRLARVNAELDKPDDVTAEPSELVDARSVEKLALLVLAVVEDKLGELVKHREGLRLDVSAGERSMTANRGQVSDVRGSIAAALERLGELAIEETELRMREESVAEVLRRDADASVEQALAAELPETGDDDPAARAASLAAELDRMGPVNLLATEEFRELDERHQLISEQLSDLEESRAELTRVITVLDTEMETLFSQTFEDTARHYRNLFAVLFPGGTGSLRLTCPEDPLAAGVEIEAQPLGKKVGKLTLLSGGERSLAALAFLFAVFKARPGPFYIVDEVDAALDDTNLHRFLRLVDEFHDDAQLIVITHQQATIRAADILYGVTMEPGGSSKALVRRMDREPSLAKPGDSLRDMDPGTIATS